MKLSEKLLSISALKWQLSAGRIWCDSSLVVAVKARAIITFTSYWPASAKWWDVRGANITSVGAFSNMFKNYIIFKHQNCQKVHPIWYPQSNLQCFEVNPNYIVASWGDFFWMPKKVRSKPPLDSWKNEATLQRDIDFRCKMLVWKLSWKSWKEPMWNHVMNVDEAFDSGHNYR